jgi:hypothetical protein
VRLTSLSVLFARVYRCVCLRLVAGSSGLATLGTDMWDRVTRSEDQVSTMSPTSPERAAGPGDPAESAKSDHSRNLPVLRTPWLLLLVVAVVAAYGLLWLIGQGPFNQVYTAEWVSRRIAWFYAPVTLLLAVVSRRVLPTALSILGLVVGVAVGEVIGSPIFASRQLRLERELLAGVPQTWQPSHPGWWIASLVFLAITVAGALIARRSTHRPTRPHPGPGHDADTWACPGVS